MKLSIRWENTKILFAFRSYDLQNVYVFILSFISFFEKKNKIFNQCSFLNDVIYCKRKERSEMNSHLGRLIFFSYCAREYNFFPHYVLLRRNYSPRIWVATPLLTGNILATLRISRWWESTDTDVGKLSKLRSSLLQLRIQDFGGPKPRPARRCPRSQAG